MLKNHCEPLRSATCHLSMTGGSLKSFWDFWASEISIFEIFIYYLVLLSYTMEAVSLKLEESFLHDIEEIMKKHRYTTKTEFIREAIRDKIKDLEKEEALIRSRKLYGASKRKTTNEQLHKAGEKAFEELDKELQKN